MKKTAAVISVLIIALILATFGQPNGLLARSEPVETLDTSWKAESVLMIGGRPGAPYRGTEWTGEAPILPRITGWLAAAKPVPGPTDVGRHGNPMAIRVKLADGRHIDVEPAYDCDSRNLSTDRILRTCSPAAGEIVISCESGKIRAKSVEMYAWLTEGYKSEKLQQE